MAIDNISLRRLLRFAMSNAKKRQELLRGDIRSELKKGNGGTSKGGDFYGPFWAAAKNHVKGRSNLAVDVPKLIAANSGRKKLYTLMQKNFLEWWTEKRAWSNEPFNIFDENVKGDFHIGELGLIIKIDSVLEQFPRRLTREG